MALSFASLWAQMFPRAPAFTEKDAPDLTGKVSCLTGPLEGLELTTH